MIRRILCLLLGHKKRHTAMNLIHTPQSAEKALKEGYWYCSRCLKPLADQTKCQN